MGVVGTVCSGVQLRAAALLLRRGGDRCGRCEEGIQRATAVQWRGGCVAVVLLRCRYGVETALQQLLGGVGVAWELPPLHEGWMRAAYCGMEAEWELCGGGMLAACRRRGSGMRAAPEVMVEACTY